MAYKKLFSFVPGEFAKNAQTAVQFLVEQFGALHRNHPFHDNLVIINGRSWWVIPATSNQGVDICNGRAEDPRELVTHIKKLQAGVIIFRQMVDNRLCIYELANLELLRERLDSGLILLWDTIEIIKSGSDIGIMVGDELIGFRKLRSARPAPITPMSRTAVDI